ncbi:MAG: substrate-binding domain-containing protein, partial [Actinobacteria bacterium]|nr:substrate-binding domain-containing protein [Actinomycetota bacterium]
ELKQVADRLAGTQAALASARLGAGRFTVVPTEGMTVAAGRIAGQDVLDRRRSERPSAVVCANDLLALGVLQVLTERGLRAPADLAIVGYDDIDFAAAAAVPLTSVRQPRQELGRTATELLIEEAEPAAGKRHRHRQVVFAPELVARASTVGG